MMFFSCSRYRKGLGGRWVGWISESESTFISFGECGYRPIHPTTAFDLPG
jgi:hypothetical protein